MGASSSWFAKRSRFSRSPPRFRTAARLLAGGGSDRGGGRLLAGASPAAALLTLFWALFWRLFGALLGGALLGGALLGGALLDRGGAIEAPAPATSHTVLQALQRIRAVFPR